MQLHSEETTVRTMKSSKLSNDHPERLLLGETLLCLFPWDRTRNGTETLALPTLVLGSLLVLPEKPLHATCNIWARENEEKLPTDTEKWGKWVPGLQSRWIVQNKCCRRRPESLSWLGLRPWQHSSKGDCLHRQPPSSCIALGKRNKRPKWRRFCHGKFADTVWGCLKCYL